MITMRPYRGIVVALVMFAGWAYFDSQLLPDRGLVHPWVIAVVLGVMGAAEILRRGVTVRRLMAAMAVFAVFFGIVASIRQ